MLQKRWYNFEPGSNAIDDVNFCSAPEPRPIWADDAYMVILGKLILGDLKKTTVGVQSPSPGQCYDKSYLPKSGLQYNSTRSVL
jgi:hypothetical protein